MDNEKRTIDMKNNNKLFSQEKDCTFYNDKNSKKMKESLTKENNSQTNHLINSKMKKEEKLKLQIFYSEHLNSFRLNKPKKIFENNKINTDLSKNYKGPSFNNDSTILIDLKTSQDTIEKKYKTVKQK